MASIIRVDSIRDSGDNVYMSSDGSGIFTTSGLGLTFASTINANQSLSHETITKLNFDTEIYDTNSAYSTSDKRFTVPSGKQGYYKIGAKVCFEASANSKEMIGWLKIRKNGDDIDLGGGGTNQSDFYQNGSASGHRNIMTITDFIINLSAGDYLEAYGYQGHNDSSSANARADYSLFYGYKLIGV